MGSFVSPVAVIGDALIDEVRDEHGSRDYVGGAALNVAVALARLGVPATLIAMVAEDADGIRIRETLAQQGVRLIATPAPRGTARAVSDRTAGEPRYVFSEAARGRSIDLGLSARAALRAAPVVVASCCALDDLAQVRSIEGALPPGRRLLLDPNPREGMLRSSAEFVRGFERLADRAMLVKIGEDDSRLLYDTDVDTAMRSLADRGVPRVAATRGRDGASVLCAGVEEDRPIADLPGDVVDTMGAGDAVLAVLAAHLVAMVAEQDALAVHPATAGADAADLDHAGTIEADAAWGTVLEEAMRVAAATCRHEGALLRTA